MTISGSARITACMTDRRSSASATTASAPCERSEPTFCSDRVIAVTSWPLATRSGTRRCPTAPDAPATKTFMYVLLPSVRPTLGRRDSWSAGTLDHRERSPNWCVPRHFPPGARATRSGVAFAHQDVPNQESRSSPGEADGESAPDTERKRTGVVAEHPEHPAGRRLHGQSCERTDLVDIAPKVGGEQTVSDERAEQ